MDHAVSLVQACLQRNGYCTVVEYPIIGTADSQMDALTRRWFYRRLGNSGYLAAMHQYPVGTDARSFLQRLYRPRFWKRL